jgi:hypothetical protein
MPKTEIETTKATARLPNLHVEIGHWRSPGGDSEQISITLQAVPSFAEFGCAHVPTFLRRGCTRMRP